MSASWGSQGPERFVLENGLRVFLIENHSTPSVSLNLTVLTGSRDEPEARAGTAVMANRLLDEGTATRTSREIAEAVESVGGIIDSDCSYDRFGVFLTILSKDIPLGLELVSDMVREPAFSPGSIQNERDRTLAEIQSAMDRPQVVAGWAFNELVYFGHPLHRPVCGYPETIRGIKKRDLQEFHAANVLPNNAVLSVVGDFRMPEMFERLATSFGAWEQRPRTTSPPPMPAKAAGIRARFLQLTSQQAHIYFGHLGISRMDPDYYTLQVMDTILGGGSGLTARIPHKLRDEQGLAYTTFASITNSAGMDPGRFLAYIATSPGNVDAALDGFIAEIDRVRSERVSEEEIDDAKAYLTGSFVFGFETNAQLARFLINAELFDLGFDYVDRYAGYVERVTADMIERAASAHLSTEDYVLVVGGPESAMSNRRFPATG